MAYESPEPHSGGETTAGELRASHHDRARVVRQLQHAAVEGRLEPAELEDRVAAALSARTLGDLAPLVSDLPVPPPLSPAQRDRIESDLYHAKRDGRWTVPSQLYVRVNSGSVILDFTEAEITSPSLEIDASVRGGSLILITRPGIDVHTHDLTVDKGTVKFEAPWGEDAASAVLTITVTGGITVGELIARPPRRNLKQRLRGDPSPFTTGS